MALADDLPVFFADFGVTAQAGTITGKAILDLPGQVVLNGMVINTDYTLTAKAADFGGLLYGDAITVDGVAYSVRENRRIDDGQLVEILLTKLAPDSTAPGANPADYSLSLADLGDVVLADPTAGEVLKYDGSKWRDGRDEGTAFVFTQSTPSALWIINHNLGHVPTVEVFDAGSQEVEADIANPSTNQTNILFTVPTAGFARLI